ncbi:MAG TPA: hypothetical protein VMZ52_20200 [Bryobacteraceae bacterium]|nr:hypothetical protein [Bryobacteraceae bacterium]
MRGLVAALALLPATLLVATRSDYLSIKQKFNTIEQEKAKPGSRVPISAQELNAYVQKELPEVAPEGIRNPSVQLDGNNAATGRALIDFLKLRSARGKNSNWLMRKLLEGEHEVAVTARVESGTGKATVFIEKVEVAGVPIEGQALDYLIQNYLLPNYPDAKIGTPFALKHKVDRLEVRPGMAYVIMRR